MILVSSLFNHASGGPLLSDVTPHILPDLWSVAKRYAWDPSMPVNLCLRSLSFDFWTKNAQYYDKPLPITSASVCKLPSPAGTWQNFFDKHDGHESNTQ